MGGQRQYTKIPHRQYPRKVVLEYISLRSDYSLLFLMLQSFLYKFFPLPSPRRVSHIIYLILGNFSLPFVDCAVHHLSACPIRHLSKPLVSCGGQDSTVQGSSSHKCSQEVQWDALNVGVATTLSVMLGLTLFRNFFLAVGPLLAMCH